MARDVQTALYYSTFDSKLRPLLLNRLTEPLSIREKFGGKSLTNDGPH